MSSAPRSNWIYGQRQARPRRWSLLSAAVRFAVLGVLAASLSITGCGGENVSGTDDLAFSPWFQLFAGLAVLLLILSLIATGKRMLGGFQSARKGLAESRAREEAVVRNALEGVITVDEDGRLLSCNPAAEKLFRYGPREVLGQSISKLLLLDSGDAEEGQSGLPLLLAQAAERPFEAVGRRKDGSEVPLEVSIADTTCGGQRVRYVFLRDLTDRRLVEQQQLRLESFTEKNPHPIIETDLAGAITYMNPEASQQFPDLASAKPFHPLLQDFPDILHRLQHERERTLVREVQVGKAFYEEHIIYIPRGRCIRIFALDISNRRHATKDPLTGLPNRMAFTERLEEAQQSAASNPGRCFAVLFLDLDHFKDINDGLGHMLGDQLLKAVSGRLESSLRPKDMVARLGGDEFTVLLDSVREEKEATAITSRILQKIRQPFELSSHTVFTSASIGIVLSSVPHKDSSDLIEFADAAMYRAKMTGRARCTLYDPKIDARALPGRLF